MTLTETRRPSALDIDTMRATVFHGPGDIRVESVPQAPCRRWRGRHPRHHDDDLRHRHPYPEGRIPGPTGPDHRPRAGRRHRRARRRRHRLRDRPARPRRRDHSVRPVSRLPVGQPEPVRPWRGLRGARRLALRQHDRRRAGRVPPRPVCPGQPHAHPGWRDRRAGRPPRRHRVDRVQRPRIGRRQDRRLGRRLRPGSDRPVRDGRRQVDGRVAHHRRRQRPGPARDGQEDGRRRCARLHPGRRRWPRSSG